MFKSLGLLHNLEAFIIGPSTTTERILGRRGARVYRIASNVRYTTETAIEYQLAAAVLRIVNSKFSSTFCLPRIQHVLLSASSIGCQSLNELHFLYVRLSWGFGRWVLMEFLGKTPRILHVSQLSIGVA